VLSYRDAGLALGAKKDKFIRTAQKLDTAVSLGLPDGKSTLSYWWVTATLGARTADQLDAEAHPDGRCSG